MLSRILLVDDHAVVRAGLARLLKDFWDVCGEAENGREAIDKVLELKPDLVLLDLGMPVMGGTEAARQIRQLSPGTKIVFLSMHDFDTVAQVARLAGADGCLSKHCGAAELKKTVEDVLRQPSEMVRLLDPT